MTYQVNFCQHLPTIKQVFLWLSFGCGMVDGFPIYMGNNYM
ncbi:hypothetical protein [Lactococcus cremoris]|nr:hypothetical protein [Lactococcus cremoris]WKD56498.1 hypothetical protein LLW34_02660 [Lactococcus cremoris]